jgi:hypothetical protein
MLAAFRVTIVSVAMLAVLPSGWRRPTAAEAGQEWRQKDKDRFLVATGDFDGDKKTDRAEIVVSSDGEEFAIAVWLSGDSSRPLTLERAGIGSLSGMGISRVEPGHYETACGKGYGEWTCSHGEPKSLALRNQAIDFFANGSADVILYWDEKTKQFNRIQMSD